MQQLTWKCGQYTLNLNRPIVMGILNVTPDSFSDAGQSFTTQAAIRKAHMMLDEGADIIDIGGESTRPNAQPVSAAVELARIIPVLESLRDCGKPISVDTHKPSVMRAAIDSGASIINDVKGFNSPAAIDAAANSNCGLCVMHMKGTPQTMQEQAYYTNIVTELAQFFEQQIMRLTNAGIVIKRICIDPGIGFGKTLEHNKELLNQLKLLANTAILIGVSRKRIIGELTGKEVEQRVSGSIAAALYGITNGAHIVRVHDVAQTVDALKVWNGLSKQ